LKKERAWWAGTVEECSYYTFLGDKRYTSKVKPEAIVIAKPTYGLFCST
jgi:hypothetical protein